MTIIANGKKAQIESSRLMDYLVQSGWKSTQVVVELNGQVVPRGKVSEIQLNDGDQLEVIVPVAGG